jgi:hypothetical protein
MSSLRSEARSLTIVRGILAGLTIALCGLPLSAQVTSGTITGRVQDSTGAAIKDASVTVSNPSNGLTRNLTTSDAGEFVAPNLLPGTYNVIVEAPGFKKLETKRFTLSAAGKLDTGTLVLSVGAVANEVTVTADAGQVQIQADSGERSDLITNKQPIPDMSFNGLTNTNFAGSHLGGTPWKQANTTINVNDNLTWVKQKHTLKAGVFYQRNRKDQPAWGNINGQFSFGTGFTAPSPCPADTTCGDPLASALLGQFDSFDQSTARPLGKFRYNQVEFYVQDTWKIRPPLTLDYGMRFAWIPPQYDANNQVALFDPYSYNPANAVTIDPNSGNIITADGGDPLNGMKFANQNQIPKRGWDSRGIMAEPRFGFAYDLLGTHKSILRGGFGMTHDRTQGNLIGKSEARYIQLRLEAFNVFNHPNFQDKNFGANVTGPWAYASPTDALTLTKNDNWGTYSDTYGTGPGGFRVRAAWSQDLFLGSRPAVWPAALAAGLGS